MDYLIQIVDDDDNILFDLDDATGANNPSGLKTCVFDLDLGAPSGSRQFWQPDSGPGGHVVHQRDELVAMSWRQGSLGAADPDDYRDAIEALMLLLDAPGIIKLQPTPASQVRYLDYLGGPFAAMMRGQAIAAQKLYEDMRDLPGPLLSLMRQPGFRSAEVTGSQVVPNNPATANGRVITIDVEGDLPTPVDLTVIADASSKLSEVFVAKNVGQGLADYASTRKYVQSEAGTLSNGAASAADATASGTRVTITPATLGVNLPRVRHNLTTLLDSLRGTFDVYARIKAGAAGNYEYQLRWGVTNAGALPFIEDPVSLDTTGLSDLVWVDQRLGRISVPIEGDLAQVTLEVWTKAITGGAHYIDFLTLVAADPVAGSISRIIGDADEPEIWLGSNLGAITSPAGIGTGTVNGDEMDLVAGAVQGGGTPPSTGLVWGIGVHEVTFEFDHNEDAGNIDIRVRNVTDGTNAAILTESLPASPGVRTAYTRTLHFEGVAAKAYQAQLVKTTSSATVRVYIKEITHRFLPYAAAGEKIRSKPQSLIAERLSATDQHLGPFRTQGPPAIWLDPGPNALYFHFADAIKSGYENGESVIGRSPTVGWSYEPRHSQG